MLNFVTQPFIERRIESDAAKGGQRQGPTMTPPGEACCGIHERASDPLALLILSHGKFVNMKLRIRRFRNYEPDTNSVDIRDLDVA